MSSCWGPGPFLCFWGGVGELRGQKVIDVGLNHWSLEKKPGGMGRTLGRKMPRGLFFLAVIKFLVLE